VKKTPNNIKPNTLPCSLTKPLSLLEDPSNLPPTTSSLYSSDSEEDSDVDGTVEDMENMMSTSFSLRPTVSEIGDLAESWTLNQNR
jgi:hypothetical protein